MCCVFYKLHSHAFAAYRPFTSSLHAKQVQESIPPPGSTEIPVTEIAQRGSNQLSLQQPQNKAGGLLYSLVADEDACVP